jgi:hypothetical protein
MRDTVRSIYRRSLALVLVFALAAGFASMASAEIELEVRLTDTLVSSGAEDVILPLFLTNPTDSIAGFALLLETNHPQLISFNLTRETEGTLIEDWEYVSYSNPGNNLSRLRIVALAATGSDPITYGIPPQYGYTPLLMISIDAHDVLDTITVRTALTIINHDNVQNFGFSDPHAQLIGVYVDSVLDTAYWHCLVWEEPDSICTEWEWLEEPIHPDDSFLVYWKHFEDIDLEAVVIDNGSITVTGGYKCGDVDGDGNDVPNISDLITMVLYMFQNGDEPPVMAAMDANGDGSVDIVDLIWIVKFMFSNGVLPVCGY